MLKASFFRLAPWCIIIALLGTSTQAPGQIPTPAMQPPTTSGDTRTAAAPTAEKFIQSLGNRAISIVSDQSLSKEQRDQNYYQILREAFDTKMIGRFVLGRTWNTATQEQQSEYLKLFEALVVKIYGNKLSFYSGEGFRVTGSRKEGQKDAIVSTEITYPSGRPPTKIDWRVRQSGEKLAIIDVVIEGISQSVTQRQEYAAILQRNNGNIEGLLNDMRTKVNGG